MSQPTHDRLAPRPPARVGAQLRRLRLARGTSQMALALPAGVSTRHLGFVEIGRAWASMTERASCGAGLT